MINKTAAIDFESYYDDNYGLKELGTWQYVFDPRFDAYLVSVHGDNIHWVGHPKKFDWTQLAGYTLLAHNVMFDGLVWQRLVKDGTIPSDLPIVEWFDTADLAAYLRCQRNLKDASKYLLQKEVSKDIRKKMKGKTFQMACDAGMEKQLLEYGLHDSELTFELWQKYGDKWPECERKLSRLNREACWRGVPVNRDAINHALTGTGAKEFPGWKTDAAFEGLDFQSFNAKRAIPWVKDGLPPLSVDCIRAEADKVGIPIPSSFDAKDPDAIEWENTYAPRFPWVKAIRNWRRTNTMAHKVRNLLDGTRNDDTFVYNSKYFGSHTGRFSGGGEKDAGNKFNIMNQYKKIQFGVDLRKLLAPPPGYKFIIIDYAQVEARVLLWRVGDVHFLDLLRKEGNLYQAYAKQQKRYNGANLKAENKVLYEHSKAAVLSSGYQCGWKKYQAVAEVQYDIELDEEEARAAIQSYRSTFPLVPAHWSRHQRLLWLSVDHHDPTHEVELASGRSLVYFEPTGHVSKWPDGRPNREAKAKYVLGAPAKKLYGGLLTENEIQATCRDLLRDAWVATAAAGYPPVFSVYDELVFMVPDADATPGTVKELRRIMHTSSPWLEGCPIDTEAHILDYYTK